MNAHTLTGQEASRAFEAKWSQRARQREFLRSTTLAYLNAMDRADMLGTVLEAVQNERFADFDVRHTAMVDRGLTCMLEVAEADRSAEGWAL